MMKLAILDRDGTLNALGDGAYIDTPEDWIALPGALEAVARLNPFRYTQLPAKFLPRKVEGNRWAGQALNLRR